MATYVDLPIPDTPQEKFPDVDEFSKFERVYDAFRVLREKLPEYFITIGDLPAGNGILVRTGTNSWELRTLQQPAEGLTITNADGVAGNPTFALANDLAALEALGATGIAVRTAADTWAQRTITGTANEITLTNGNGVAGNPVVSLPAALTFTGKTITDGTFTGGTFSGAFSGTFSGAFDGTLGATTPSTVAATTVRLGTTPITAFSINGSGGTQIPALQVNHNNADANSAGLLVSLFSGNISSGANITIAKGNNGTLGTMTVVDSGELLGRLAYDGSDGTQFVRAAAILGFCDGAASAGIVPGRLEFHTRNAAGTIAERAAITAEGRLTFTSNGSASAPLITFSSGRGFYDDGAGSVNITDGTRLRHQFRMQASASGIEIGRQDNVAESAYLDFHSGATSVDYDARIISTGGTGALGGSTLSIEAGIVSTTVRFSQASASAENPTIGQIIVTNSTDNAQFRKATPAHLMQEAGAYHRLATTSIATGTNTTTINLPTTRDWAYVDVVIRGLTAGSDFAAYMRVNADSTGGNYRYALQAWAAAAGAATVGGGGVTPGCWNLFSTAALTESTNGVFNCIIRIYNPRSTTVRKTGSFETNMAIAQSDGLYYGIQGKCAWLSTSAITSFTLHLQNTAAQTIGGSGVNATAGVMEIWGAF